MHFTVYLTVKLQRPFNCNFTSICNSVTQKPRVYLLIISQIPEVPAEEILTIKIDTIELKKKFICYSELVCS